MVRVLHRHGWMPFCLVATASCVPPTLGSQVPQTDKQSIRAQELGEMQAPVGACPGREESNVLGNPRSAVQRTALGLAYCFLKEGPPGVVPAPTDSVLVRYSGWTTEGSMFDSSIERGDPVEFALNDVIGGWAEGLRLMTPGDKARLWVPPHLGYGQQKPTTKGESRPKGVLIFEIELLAVKKAPAPEPEQAATEAEPEPKRRLAPREVPAEKEPTPKKDRDTGHQH